jgi:hypothetical protein
MNESASEASGATDQERQENQEATPETAQETQADPSVTEPDPQDPSLAEVQQMAASARASGCLNVARILDEQADELEYQRPDSAENEADDSTEAKA